jgi:hypothetical protein
MKLEDKDLCDHADQVIMQKQKMILMLAITITTTIVLLSTLIQSSVAYLKYLLQSKGNRCRPGVF